MWAFAVVLNSTCLLINFFFFFTQENLKFSDHPVSIEGLRPGFPYCWSSGKSFKAFQPLTSRMEIISICTVVVLSTYPSVLTSSPPPLGAFRRPCSPLPRGYKASGYKAMDGRPLCSSSILCTARLIVVPLLSHVWLCVCQISVCQASLSFTISRSLLRLMSIESGMPSNHLILCCPLLLLPSIFSSIRVLSNELALRIRWPKYWNFSFSIRPSSEYSGLISFRMDWFDLLAVQGTLKSLLHHQSKAYYISTFFSDKSHCGPVSSSR